MSLIKYKDRAPKLPARPKPFIAGEKATDEWYSYLINEWIPNQPDSEKLMYLFIECGFRSDIFIMKINPTEKNTALLKQIED